MLKLRSFKIRIADTHVRIVPDTDSAGCPFAGPGVDLRGAGAQQAIAQAQPILQVLQDIEPGVIIRSIAVDLVRPRVTATLDPTTPLTDARPRVIRIEDGMWLRVLVDKSRPLCEYLAVQAEQALQRRKNSG